MYFMRSPAAESYWSWVWFWIN